MPLKLHMKVGICIPSGQQWEADFGMCLINLFTHVLTRPMKGVRQIHLVLINERTSLLPKTRQALLDRAIQLQCDYALMIDTDQTFASNLLYALLRHNLPIVAANVATKSIPASPTARSFNASHPGGNCVFTDPQSKGVERVWRIGTGVMLIDLEPIKKLPKPWFQVLWRPEQNEFVGEDWYFCEQLEKAGIPIYIDHDVSKDVGHVGKLVYGHQLVGEVVREEAAQIAALEPKEPAPA